MAKVTGEIRLMCKHSVPLKPFSTDTYIWMLVTYFRQVVRFGLTPGNGINAPFLRPH